METIKNLKIKDLKKSEYNPRKITEQELKKLENSIKIIVNLINSNIYKVGGFKDTMPIIKFCEECSKQFKVRPSQYKKRKTCSFKCAAKRRMKLVGRKAPNWKGGIEIHSEGYIWIYCPKHPKAHKGKIAEHRFIMEKCIKRYLTTNEIVHHINGNKKDNRIENLELYNRSSHAKLHHPKGRRFGQ